MSIHVFIVGSHPSRPHTPFDEIFERSRARQTSTFRVLRCSSPADVFGLVQQEVRACNMPIRLLDFLDHGGAGYIRMGDPLEPPLFSHDAPDMRLAEDLSLFLMEGARVRLVGCETAVGEQGQRLLTRIAMALGKSAVVQGTIACVNDKDSPARRSDFDEQGFRAAREEWLLFSSTEAAHRVAPSAAERQEALTQWRRDVG
jgi:hypothetical protein